MTTAPAQTTRPTKPVLAKPQPIDLTDVEWTTGRDADGRTVLCLTAREYQDLSLNMAEILRYVNEADQQLEYYRRKDGE